jgi:hypothetical protein
LLSVIFSTPRCLRFSLRPVERTLFVRIQAGRGLNALKRDFQKRFGITARQFNAVHAGLHGKSKSIKERQPELIDSLQDGSSGLNRY